MMQQEIKVCVSLDKLMVELEKIVIFLNREDSYH